MDAELRAYIKAYQAKMCDGRWSSVELGMATGLFNNGNTIVLIIASIATSLCCPMF